tara:strand:- start:36202 stop:36639 length:438 start_codon:yes stop_codon:yes gene_type:complete
MIVVSPYYKDVSAHLLDGALAYLKEKRATSEVFEITGALEIPMAIKYGALRKEGRGSENRKFDAYIALGCVIRGETSHYDIVCNESAAGLSRLALDHNLPIGNGILTCDTLDQAMVRAEPMQKNKGADAAQAALALFELSCKLRR